MSRDSLVLTPHLNNISVIECDLEMGADYLKRPFTDPDDINRSLSLLNNALALSHEECYTKGQDEVTLIKSRIFIRTNFRDSLITLLATAGDSLRALIMIEQVRYKIFDQGLRDEEMDSVLTLVGESLVISKSVQSPSLKTSALLQFGNIYFNQCYPELGSDFYDMALANVNSNAGLEPEAEIFSQMSSFASRANGKLLITRLNELRDRMLKSYEVNQGWPLNAKLRKDVITGNDNVVYHYLYGGDFSNALRCSLQMLVLLEKYNFNEISEVPFQAIAKIYLELGKTDLSIKYYERALHIVYDRGGSMDGNTLKNFTKALIKANKPRKALGLLNESITKGSAKQLCDSRLIKESIGNCYYELGNLTVAEMYYLQGLRESDLLGEENHLPIYFPLGRLYLKKGQFRKAKKYLNELVLEQNAALVPPFVRRDVHQLLFKIDSATGNYLSAIQHMNEFKALNDFLFNEKRSGQIEELKLEYETEQTDQSLSLRERDISLLTKQGDLQKANLSRAQLSRNAIIGGSVVLFVLSGMLYSRYQLKQRTYGLLRAKQERINLAHHQLVQLNGDLQKLVSEKEWLIKEIHHRVKNNLQIVVSLLNTQASYLKDGDALVAIRESRSRMQVISLLHQRLYNIDDSRSVDMQKYIAELIGYLSDSYRGYTNAVFKSTVEDIRLDISQAISVGLILNESVTNSIKYAFDLNQSGIIDVSLTHQPDYEILLRIADNGKGFPIGSSASKKNSLGMQLMETLSDQIDGKMVIESERGVIISILFRSTTEEHNLFTEKGQMLG